jgi:hypothetical protein
MPTQCKSELMGILDNLAEQLRLNPQSEAANARLEALVRSGDKPQRWIYDYIIDKLTAGDDTYSESIENWISSTGRVGISVNPAGAAIRTVSIDRVPASQLLERNVADIINQLVRIDFTMIARTAKLKRIEQDVWYYWLRGYKPIQMARFLYNTQDELYTVNAIRKIQHRTFLKIWKCPLLGMETCRREDIARSKHGKRPNYMSVQDMIDATIHPLVRNEPTAML